MRFLTIFILFFISFKVSNADSYGSYGNLVYRADSSGNTIWVKNFNGQLIPPPVSGNQVRGVSFDGTFIYVLNLQIRVSGSITYHYVSIVVLDTNGTALTSQTRIESSANGYTLGTMLPSFTSGAWYSERHGPGFTHVPSIRKVDSLGQDVTIVSAWFISAAEIKTFIALKDSTYLIAANGYSTSGPSTQTSALIKFDDSGNIIWAKCYNIPSVDYLEFRSSVGDENGNIYSIGYYSTATGTFAFGLKVDSTGTPILFRTWTTLGFYGLSFRDNEIITLYSGQEVHFDSLLQNSCFTSTLDSVSFSITAPYPLATGGSNLSSFTPTDTSLTLITNTYLDYCAVLKVDEIEKKKILVFPNPTDDKIKLELNDYNNLPNEIKIFDSFGKEVYSNYNVTSESIDVFQFTNGLYYLKVKYSDIELSGKFIKQ